MSESGGNNHEKPENRFLWIKNEKAIEVLKKMLGKPILDLEEKEAVMTALGDTEKTRITNPMKQIKCKD